MTDFEQKLLIGLVLANVASAGTAFWWVVNKMSANNAAIHGRIDKHIEATNERFVRKTDFEKFDEKLTKQLDKISDKLDRLTDRTNAQRD